MLSIGVIGAGVGGLTAALALREAGFSDIAVYEAGSPGRAASMDLILPPNATRVLHALGLKDELQGISGHPQFQLHRTWRSGFLLSQRPLGQFAEDRYGAPHCVVDHVALLGMLLEACATHAIGVIGERACTDLAQTGNRVVAAFGDLQATHDVLIGCDGADSRLRNRLNYPDAVTHPDQTAWWGTAPIAAVPRSLAGNAITTWLGPRQFLTHWPSPDGQHIAYLALLKDAAPDLSAAFADWHPGLTTLFNAGHAPRSAPVREHEPITQWYDRRVVLLGDACHALPPHLQQGAALAMEDAWVLSRMLERWEDDPAAGFNEYQRYRKARVTRMRRASRFHEAQWTVDSPRQALVRNIKLSLGSRFLPEMAMAQLDWLYGYDCIRGFE